MISNAATSVGFERPRNELLRNELERADRPEMSELSSVLFLAVRAVHQGFLGQVRPVSLLLVGAPPAGGDSAAARAQVANCTKARSIFRVIS